MFTFVKVCYISFRFYFSHESIKRWLIYRFRRIFDLRDSRIFRTLQIFYGWFTNHPYVSCLRSPDLHKFVLYIHSRSVILIFYVHSNSTLFLITFLISQDVTLSFLRPILVSGKRYFWPTNHEIFYLDHFLSLCKETSIIEKFIPPISLNFLYDKLLI